MKKNLNRWGGGRTSVAGKPFFPGKPPMSTLDSGGERRGMLLGMNERFRGLNGDEHGLRPQELDECPSDLATWPIAKAAQAEPEQEEGDLERLAYHGLQQMRVPHRRPAQHILEGRQQEEKCVARTRRSRGGASWWSQTLDTVRATGRDDTGQCGRHTARAASRCALVCVLAQTADGLPGNAAFHQVVAQTQNQEIHA
jgi:hypothetical protein